MRQFFLTALAAMTCAMSTLSARVRKYTEPVSNALAPQEKLNLLSSAEK